MHGLLLVDKPIGLSSAAVVAKVKNRFRFKKVGHGGTLDPFASGLLVLLIGDGTKIARFLLEGDKTYDAEADLRFETDTGDNTGTPLPPEHPHAATMDRFAEALPRFCGTILQRPPMYSAIKRDGKPLYAYAREGKTLAIPEREVSIRSLEILHFADNKLRFRVTCSGGTYIRVLAQDWARASGTQAHLAMLQRTHSHNFSLPQAHNLDSLLSNPSPPSLIPLAQALSHLPAIPCDQALAKMLRNGHPQALVGLNPLWPEDAPYVLALESNAPENLIAILSRAKGAASASIERVFDQATR